MIKIVLCLFLIGHVLGDFYLQSSKLAEEKNKIFIELIKHSTIYFICLVIALIPVINVIIFRYIIIVSLMHFFVDYYKGYLHNKIFVNNSKKEVEYIVDQIAHILIIFVVIGIITISQEPIQYIDILASYISKYSIDVQNLISWMLIILIIVKPISISIKVILKKYQPSKKEEVSGINNAGSLIGIMERIFILLMLSVSQYSAIGFVLTAKSIARYNKIIEDSEFSEYYLLGTLMSAILVIGAYFLVF